MATRALAFDVFGTLVDWRSGIARAFAEAGAPADAAALADSWRAKYRPILAEVNEHRRPWANFDDLHMVTLNEVLAEKDLDLSRSARSQLVRAWHTLEPWPDVRCGLESLRRTHVISMLSNGHIALLIDLARHGDLRFDCVLSAELANAYKPAPQAYLTAAKLLEVKPAELMLVAAHPWDLDGARAAGLQTAFVRRPLEYGSGAPASEDPDADLTAETLDELAGLLSASTR
ncbi:haloacid dehalogenase type II [Mycolicibacterium palauense]|uniref:haloacid dehalogenase type II n=1 Tax=Mycolicibacterium palauense TaxID=2034511 RepID=UPI000BFEB20C|nr:haloacid dehalogenase type II [Mycolicibacterium palauense]